MEREEALNTLMKMRAWRAWGRGDQNESERPEMPCQKDVDAAFDVCIEMLSSPHLPTSVDKEAERFNREDAARMWSYEGKTEGEIVEAAFKAGAKLIYEQCKTIGETEIYLEDDGGEEPYVQKWLDLATTEFAIPDGFSPGDKVIVQIRKKTF